MFDTGMHIMDDALYLDWLKHDLVPSLGLRGGSGRLSGWEVSVRPGGVQLGFVGLTDLSMRVQLHDSQGSNAQSWRRAAGQPLACLNGLAPEVRISFEVGTRSARDCYLRLAWTRRLPNDFLPELERVKDCAQRLMQFAKFEFRRFEPVNPRRLSGYRATGAAGFGDPACGPGSQKPPA